VIVPPRVCVIGSCNLDLTFRVPRLPATGETCAGSAFTRGFGGKGANQAVMAARMGASVALIGRLGADAFGADYRQHLTAEGVDTTGLTDDPQRPTGVAGIWVQADGQNAIVGVPGANAGLTPADVEAAAPLLRSAAVVVAPLEVPLDAVTAGFRIARSAGALTALNPSPVWPLPAELWALADVLVLNETEAAQLTGLPADQPEVSAGELLGRGPRGVLLTLGSRGALVVKAAGCVALPALAVVAVDTTGAGDAFLGAWAACRAGGADDVSAARWACRAAALSVTRHGAQESYPHRAEVEAQEASSTMR
jgi:ribokinase